MDGTGLETQDKWMGCITNAGRKDVALASSIAMLKGTYPELTKQPRAAFPRLHR